METARIGTLAVLGAGKMGGALVHGWTTSGVLEGSRVRLYDVDAAAARSVAAAATGAVVASSAAEAVQGADLLLVSVKPHVVLPALGEARDAVSPGCLVL